MKYLSPILLAIVLAFTMTACGSKLSPQQQALISNQTILYTQVPLWLQKNRVYGTNYKVGTVIPLNSQVRIVKIGSKDIIFNYQGANVSYLLMKKHTRVTTTQLLSRAFGEKPVDLSGLSPAALQNILSTTVVNGMTKNEVLLARGYPPFHKTPSILSNSWRFWSTTRRSAAISFQNDKVTGLPETISSIAQMAVKNIYKTNYGQKIPYTFATSKKSLPNSFALIIGINNYQMNTAVEFADKSAMAFAELANKTFGIPKENIITLTNEQATSGQIKSKIELLKELADTKGNIYFYFAGHGVPGKDGSSYLLPYDMTADAIHLEQNLKLDNIYKKLSKVDVKKVFFFMDSCFSGKDDKGGLLYKGVAPVLKTKKVVVDDRKLTILTAGQSSDFANDLQEKQQRMFSYYLIENLSNGETNLNKVYGKLKNKVKRASLFKGLGYKQIPQIYGNKEHKLY